MTVNHQHVRVDIGRHDTLTIHAVDGWRAGPVRAPLVTCEECGAAVPAGLAQQQHELWHGAIVATILGRT